MTTTTHHHHHHSDNHHHHHEDGSAIYKRKALSAIERRKRNAKIMFALLSLVAALMACAAMFAYFDA